MDPTAKRDTAECGTVECGTVERWHRGVLVKGHGVASGLAAESPYPAGTISLQAPLFQARGIDLEPFFDGTLNLAFPGSRWSLRQPDARVNELRWTDLHPPETFSFWRIRLRWRPAVDGAGAVGSAPDGLGFQASELPWAPPVEGLIYRPHPETKRNHHQPVDQLELLAPWIAGIAAAQELQLGVDPRRCRRIVPQVLKAQLLEALKFRVLASQHDFFNGFGGLALVDRAGPEPKDSLDSDDGLQAWPEALAFRRWLVDGCCQALDLRDAELLGVLRQAWQLYGHTGSQS